LVFCPFVSSLTNGSYLFANGLNGLKELNKLAHLWVSRTISFEGDPINRYNFLPALVLIGQYLKKIAGNTHRDVAGVPIDGSEVSFIALWEIVIKTN
jgi:hypothetical protein